MFIRLLLIVVFLVYMLLFERLITSFTLFPLITCSLLSPTFLSLYYISLNPLSFLCHIPHQHHLHPLPFQPFLFFLNKSRQQLPRQVPSPYFLYPNCTFSRNLFIDLMDIMVPVTDKTLTEPSRVIVVLIRNVSFSFFL